MELAGEFIDLFLHLDDKLQYVIEQYGAWTYLILFTIVFCETGLVVTPFLPGDSLLFAAGTFAGLGALDSTLLFVLLTIAAILGDAVNYACGHYIGPRVFRYEGGWFFRRDHLERTRRVYEKYGAKTIVLARFVPIIRTFAPFLAGVGQMSYAKFATYNVVGAVAWVGIFVYAGQAFGTIPVVRENFTLVIMGIIFVSILPGIIEFLRSRWDSSAAELPASTDHPASSEQQP
jgi:membrane-associated protein